MLKRAVLFCWVALPAVALWGQPQVQIDPMSQPAVNQLAAVAHAIKECPHEVESQRQWGKKPIEIERWYIGPPQNVVWDVVPGSSVRAPYLGFIEFSLPENYWVPDEVKDKFKQSEAGSSAELAHALGDTVGRDQMKRRYEFDLGPAGLELTRMLRGNKAELVDDRPDETCWQKAARNAQEMSKQAPPQIDAGSQPAVAALRAVAQAIKECPRVTTESKETTGPTAGTLYQGPPTNLIWDVTATNSARSPYSGYIEFSLPQVYWLPTVAMGHFSKYDMMIYTSMRELWPNLKYRYEFDIGPAGLQLTRMFSRPVDKSEWSDSNGHGCWDDAARKGNAGTDTTAPSIGPVQK